MSEPSDIDELIERACNGDEHALASVFDLYRPRLRRMVLLRMDARVQTRFDASDVIQDAFLELSRRLPDYARDGKIPFFLWLRMMTGERLLQLHRTHLGTAKRNATKEIGLQLNPVPECSTLFIAAHLAGNFTSVDRNLVRDEVRTKLLEALNRMEEADREVLGLRHFEEMPTDEMAIVLGLTRSGVLKRYSRALRRLRSSVDGDLDMTMQ